MKKNTGLALALAASVVVQSAVAEVAATAGAVGYSPDAAPNPRGYGYAVFGHVTKGMDVVDKIAQVKTGSVGYFQDVPVDPVVIKSVKIGE